MIFRLSFTFSIGKVDGLYGHGHQSRYPMLAHGPLVPSPLTTSARRGKRATATVGHIACRNGRCPGRQRQRPQAASVGAVGIAGGPGAVTCPRRYCAAVGVETPLAISTCPGPFAGSESGCPAPRTMTIIAWLVPPRVTGTVTVTGTVLT